MEYALWFVLICSSDPCTGNGAVQVVALALRSHHASAFFAYFALSTPVQRPQGGPASVEDKENVALGFKLYGATTPVDLPTHDREALREALMRGANLSMAIGYAACLMIDTAESCKGK